MSKFSDLKAGDVVGVRRASNYENTIDMENVDRVTATQIVICYGDVVKRFRKETGVEIKDGYYQSTLVLEEEAQRINAGILERRELRQMQADLDRVNWKRYDRQQIEKVVALLASFEEPVVADVVPPTEIKETS
jgi:hypothetical protein